MDREAARKLLAPDLFDAEFYRREAGLESDDDAFAHYWTHGAAAGLRPNPVFDPGWYGEGASALLHYAEVGEAEGRDPSALFDVAWYRRRYGAERPLAHYLQNRFGPFSPVPEFDAEFYLAQNPDVAQARLDPFLHYLHFGFREFRKPRAEFNPRLYALRHMGGDFSTNPVAHARANPRRPAAAPRRGPHDDVRRFSRRGPAYEACDLPQGETRALLLAFHLPQFHRIAENDAWWGEGFTEWTQLSRGVPRFAGHYQPRIPGALGFYDLTNVETLRTQARLAKAAGIGAFVFYHYDFDGRRLLEKPVDLWLSTPDINLPFCLMWANENWTRRWDGAEQEVLIAQSYDAAHEAARVETFLKHFRDPRYLRLQGRPVLMVYRAGLIQDAAKAVARWRRLFAQAGENPVLVMAQTFEDVDPRPFGFDAGIEFPPHKLTRGLPQVYDQLDIFDESFEADAFAYDDLVDGSLTEPAPEFPLIRTAVPSWDNDARRQGKGLTLVGATPRGYELWLSELIDRAAPVFGRRIVAINAWNEWSEGAYLEPDAHFGWAYLNATARAARGAAPAKMRVAGGEGGRRCAAAFGVEMGPGGQELEAPADDAALFASCLPGVAKVSAFLIHRGGAFAPMRLRSLFAQTHPVFELSVLDSGEGSAEIVEAEARAAGRDLTLALDVADPFPQAARMAGGDFVWLVEARGRSDEAALAALVRALQADPRAAFAFGASVALDALGARRRPTPLSPRRLALPGGAGLAAQEMSAMLWRREALRASVAQGEADLVTLIARALAMPQAGAAAVAGPLEFVTRL